MGLILLIISCTIFLILGTIIFSFFVLKRRAAYFKKHGIPNLGSQLDKTWKSLTGRMNLIELDDLVYKEAIKTKAPIVGICDVFGQSNLYITDLDLLRHIKIKDFDHFVNLRPVKTQKSSKYFTKMLFIMENEQWKGIRAKLTPAFSTGKIRRMFAIFQNSSERLNEYIKCQLEYPKETKMDIDIQQIFFKFGMDVIANCAFGVDSHVWNYKPGEKGTFEKMAKRLEFKVSAGIIFKFTLMMLAPKIADFFEVDVMDTEGQEYFAGIVRQMLRQRRESGERREDFLQLMMDAQQGILKADEETETNLGMESAEAQKISFTDEDLVANALLFFLAGFDTLQTALLYTLYSLAVEQEVQDKLYLEIQTALNKHEGKITYDSVNEMTYLDCILNETLRLYPASTRTERACTKDYPVPGSDFVIKKGTIIAIPQYGIHMDPKYWPNPNKFDPERFFPEKKAQRHPFAFMPFGHGPRSCIAMRFALVQIKVVIANFVNVYKLEPCRRTDIPPVFGLNASAKPKNGMWLSVIVRKS